MKSQTLLALATISLGFVPPSVANANQTLNYSATGANGSNGEDGAAASLNHAFTGVVGDGSGLNIYQGVTGGAAGGVNALGGNANSILTITNGNDSSLYIYGSAIGGAASQTSNMGDANILTQATSTRSGAGVMVYSDAINQSHGLFTSWPTGAHVTAEADAAGIGWGAGIYAQSRSYAAVSGSVRASSLIQDGAGNSLKTFGSANLSAAVGDFSAWTQAKLGNSADPNSGNSPGVQESFSSGSLVVGRGVAVSSLGNAVGAINVIGVGTIGGGANAASTGLTTFTGGAEYKFSVAAGQSLVLGETSSGVFGSAAGISSLTLTIVDNGAQLYSNSFSSLAAFDAFIANPISLSVSAGAQDLVVSFTQTASAGNGVYWQYLLGSANIGGLTHTTSVAVPGPQAAEGLLSLLGLAGLIAAGRRWTTKAS